MRRKGIVSLALGLTTLMVGGAAYAEFQPKFDLTVSDTKVKGNPALDIHLEFAATDDEIGNFKMVLPKGFNIAADEKIPNASGPGESDEEIGSGEITIQAGPGCHPSNPTGQGSAPVTIPATIYEKARSDDEADAGVKAVWLLDLEPLNRVRLIVTGSAKKGWTVQGAPTPSDNTCNPLIVDITINSKSESGVPIVTNPKKPGSYKVRAEIISQDSPDVAKFTEKIKITK